ncbi:ferrous iron transport protein B [Sphingobacterium corticibacterium]|uniref:Ferrous iron transport protein B n=1 Tax=Sphingobacterium corticibacterium TaxID=2484746 RepID=A0A4Q6XMR0_9SPHI|nr:ferrous iron transport protein B [Sphingobacterium corticibacterium]RZF61383.1 ferrous iron transport protein B [Sphingobacterium corticibacterium]
MKNPIIAFLGNPNVGKTSLFNRITKLHQHVGNYPGITVEKRDGSVKANGKTYRIIDLPGTYTLFPTSMDEEIVYNVLADKENPAHPDLVVVVAEPNNIKRSIVLYQQARELGVPAIFVVNMIDEAYAKGIDIDYQKLEAYLHTKVYTTDARNGKGIAQLIQAFDQRPGYFPGQFEVDSTYKIALEEAKKSFPLHTEYQTWQFIAQEHVSFLTKEQRQTLIDIREKHQLSSNILQQTEAIKRNTKIEEDLKTIILQKDNHHLHRTNKIDKVLLHPVWGYIIFFLLLFLVFQLVFILSEPIMDWIDENFSSLIDYTAGVLPEGPLSDLLTQGVLAGIGGIIIFVPQIAILFLLISLMEETGYMSRVVFLMDRWLRPYGLNGKSVIPLMSGVGCAVPAIMAARNIENTKERLVTMLVTPFMTCAARLPIYVVLISLVIPNETFLGFGLQGLVLNLLYILGVVAALLSAAVLNKIIKNQHKSFLIFELPSYKSPDWRNVGMNMWEKTAGFLFGAGKIILAMAVILWVLGNFGPNDKFSNAEEYVQQANPTLSEEELDEEVASFRLEHSFLGYMGMGIEPFVRPLGYDWKMGIGLISSFAAREVFVGTMATVYSLGEEIDPDDDEERETLLSRMRSEINRNTGRPSYNLASGISLLLFYAFAMQCMSTIAIMKRETGSWKWTLIQTVMMTGIAYIVALVAYQLLK